MLVLHQVLAPRARRAALGQRAGALYAAHRGTGHVRLYSLVLITGFFSARGASPLERGRWQCTDWKGRGKIGRAAVSKGAGTQPDAAAATYRPAIHGLPALSWVCWRHSPSGSALPAIASSDALSSANVGRSATIGDCRRRRLRSRGMLGSCLRAQLLYTCTRRVQ